MSTWKCFNNKVFKPPHSGWHSLPSGQWDTGYKPQCYYINCFIDKVIWIWNLRRGRNTRLLSGCWKVILPSLIPWEPKHSYQSWNWQLGIKGPSLWLHLPFCGNTSQFHLECNSHKIWAPSSPRTTGQYVGRHSHRREAPVPQRPITIPSKKTVNSEGTAFKRGADSLQSSYYTFTLNLSLSVRWVSSPLLTQRDSVQKRIRGGVRETA